MARYTFNLPDIGEGIAEAEIVAWHVAVGDRVEEDGRLADLMTDKATVEMESPVSGTVLEIGGQVGDVIPIGSALVVLETGEANDGAGETTKEVEPAAAPSPEHSRAPSPAPAPPVPSTAAGAAETGPAPTPASFGTEKVLASPAVRKRASDLGIDLAEVKPGAEGRIRHADLDAFLLYKAGHGYAPAGSRRADEVVKVVGLRRRIAENLAEAKRHIPHFTYVEECDVTDLELVRAQLNEGRGDRPKLTLLPLLITAMCRALPAYPMLNARYDDAAGEVTRFGAVHMGVAAMTEAGLMVPVLRDAQDRNLWQLAAGIARLADAARSGRAASEELSGSTITISSLGPLGGIASTPIVNRPEVAILAPNRIVERPMFIRDGDGERIARRKLMNLSISCDHRVVDGQHAAAFVHEMKRLVEAPALLLTSG